MRALLDSCTFWWLITDAPDLSPRARSICRDPATQVMLSPVSLWELLAKNALGRLEIPSGSVGPGEYLARQRLDHRLEQWPLDEAAVLQLPRLPALHRDPFDRMLICQAIAHGLTLVTPDSLIRQYPVATDW